MTDFGTSHARGSDPVTSQLAAGSVESEAKALAGRIERLFEEHGWWTFTKSEIAAVLGHRCGCCGHVSPSEDQIHKRLSDLKNAGVIEPSPWVRSGRSGRAQICWRLVR